MRERSGPSKRPYRRCAILLGVPKERDALERRVAIAPPTVAKLVKMGFEVVVEGGAGEGSGYADASYEEAGAKISDQAQAYGCPLVARVNPPTLEEIEKFQAGAVLISLIYPARNEEVLQALADKKVDVIALDRVPRISRAQSMDVLSSMANLAGYRAVLEAAAVYQGFFGPQVTAAGTLRPARVLVIGAGVAGLAAIAAARSLGAEVRAFDTRLACKEQVESLGGTFLELEFEESGEGGGGYAKTMSAEFIEAEMVLFREQAAEVSVIITTALVPGKKAPILVPKDVVEAMNPGSIVVDLAAAQGGNCALTEADEVVDFQGVKILGYTDLVSRMGHSASLFFGANIANLLKEMGGGEEFSLDLENEIIRGACVAHGGALLEPPPRVVPPAAPKPAPQQVVVKSRPSAEKAKPQNRAMGTIVGGLALVALLGVVGLFSPPEFLQHFTVFVLACFVGWQVVWNVSPALHTPLMSVTNAISGVIIVGGMLQVGSGEMDLATILGLIAIVVAAINIAGGFLVTQRMLAMFRRGGS